MNNLYDPETDGAIEMPIGATHSCDFCGDTKTVWYGLNGYDFEYPCPRCNK